MIYQPTSVQPSNVAIDAKIENTFSWVFNGDSLVKYRLDIYMLNQTETTYTNTVELSTTVYGGDTVSFSLPIDSLTNGNEYIWKLTQFESNPSMFVINGKIVEATSGTSFKISTRMSTVLAGMFININGISKEIKTYDSSTGDITLETGFDTTPTVGAMYSIYTAFTTTLNGFYIKTRKTPEISIKPLSPEELDVDGSLKYRYATFTGTYSQEQNISIKYHSWELVENITNTVIVQTKDTYNSNLTFYYDGFASDVNYTLTLNIVTQDNQSVNIGYAFSVKYNQPILYDTPAAVFNTTHNSVIIDTQVIKVSNPEVTGEYEFTADGYLHVINDYITYEQINGKDIELENFTLLTEFYLDYTGSKIINLLNSKEIFQYYISLDALLNNNIPLGTAITHNIYQNDKTTTQIIEKTKGNVEPCFQNYQTPKNNIEYLWYDDMILDLESDQYFLIDDIGIVKYKLCITNEQCILQRFDGTKVTITKITNPEVINKIRLYAGVYYNYLILIDGALSMDNIERFLAQDFVPSWESFKNILIYAPFIDNLGSSNVASLESFKINSIDIYRQRKGDNILHKVGTTTLEQGYIEDFMVANGEIYTWYLIPVSDTELGISVASSPLYINFDEWTINPLLPFYEDNFYTTLETWKFGLNLEQGTLEQNILKTKFDGLSKYPKYTVEQRNYISGSLTCYLGNITVNTIKDTEDIIYYPENSIYKTSSELYYEPSNLLRKWNDLIANGNKVLIRDIKGHMYLAQIDSNNATITNYIQVSPTTISFTFTEIGDPLNLSVSTKGTNIEGVVDDGTIQPR